MRCAKTESGCKKILSYKFNVRDVINLHSGNVTVLEQRVHRRSHGKYMQNDKTYSVKCQNDGYVFDISEDSVRIKCGCPVCNNRIIIKDINDISTTQPWMLDYFVDKNDAYTNYASSTKRVLLKCPVCGELKESKISNLLYFGFSCNRCSDGISYPNKFGYLLLKELGVDFQREVKFDWCVFPSFKNRDKLSYGIYDFVVESHKLIIEMDGGIGHGKKTIKSKSRGNTSVEEQKYKDNYKDFLANQNGYTVIRIDCDYSGIIENRYKKLKQSLLFSCLSHYYNLAEVNLEEINKKASLNNYVSWICELWNSGYPIVKIVTQTKLSYVSVGKYLILGKSLNLCDYNETEARKRGNKYARMTI